MNDARVAFRLTRREVTVVALAVGALLSAAGVLAVHGARADVPGVQVHFSCPPNNNNQYDVFIFNDTPRTGHAETISGDIKEFDPQGNLVSDTPTGNIDPAKAGEFPYGPSATHPTPPEGHRFVVNITGKGVAFDQVFTCVTNSTTTTTSGSSTTTQPSSTTTSSTASNSSAGTTTITTTSTTSGGTGSSPIQVTPPTVTPGQTVTITGGGFAPNQPVQVTLSGGVIGTGTSDSAGNVSITVTIPANTSLGQQSIVLSGPAPGGGTHQAIGSVTVVAGATPASAVSAAPTFTG